MNSNYCEPYVSLLNKVEILVASPTLDISDSSLDIVDLSPLMIPQHP